MVNLLCFVIWLSTNLYGGSQWKLNLVTKIASSKKFDKFSLIILLLNNLVKGQIAQLVFDVTTFKKVSLI